MSVETGQVQTPSTHLSDFRMKRALISQSDQINELTSGLSIPLAPVGDDVLVVILEAIAQAWEYVKKQYAHTVANGSEAEVSALLITRLNRSLGADPMLSLFVSSVDRGSETVVFDGARIEVRPDLQFTLTLQDPRFRLLGECKIIDVPRKKMPKLYRDDGIARFVAGEYAWASREAIMLGYARCSAKLAPDLLNGLMQFKEMQCTAQSSILDGNPPITVDGFGRSSHDRSFGYVQGGPAGPGPIELWHLWLS